MSAFAQHDDYPAVVLTDECRFCDSPVEAFDEGTIVPRHVLIRNGQTFVVCVDHWLQASEGAPSGGITCVGGVWTLTVSS